MSRKVWNSLREEERAEEFATLTRELAAAQARVHELEERELARALPIDVTLNFQGRSLADLIPDDQRNASAMDREQAEILARCVFRHAYVGQWQCLGETVNASVRNHLAAKRAKSGQSLVDEPLATAEMALGVRTLNSLESVGITTVGHLLALGTNLPRLQIPNVGQVTIEALVKQQRVLAQRVGNSPVILPPVPARVVLAPIQVAPPAASPAADGQEPGAREQAAEFNRRFSRGTPVLYGAIKTRVQKAAFVTPAGQAVCLLEHVRGLVPIAKVTAASSSPERKEALCA